MADVILTSNVESLPAHDVYLDITLEDSSSGSHTIQISDQLGKIEYESDVPNDPKESTAVGFRGGTCKVSIENYIDSSNTFIDLLISSFNFDQDQEWLANLYFKGKTDTTYTAIPFRFRS